MSGDKEIEREIEELLNPIDELLAKEAEQLKQAAERIEADERKRGKLFPPAKRLDEE